MRGITAWTKTIPREPKNVVYGQEGLSCVQSKKDICCQPSKSRYLFSISYSYFLFIRICTHTLDYLGLGIQELIGVIIFTVITVPGITSILLYRFCKRKKILPTWLELGLFFKLFFILEHRVIDMPALGCDFLQS